MCLGDDAVALFAAIHRMGQGQGLRTCMRKPMDMQRTPWFSRGTIFLSAQTDMQSEVWRLQNRHEVAMHGARQRLCWRVHGSTFIDGRLALQSHEPRDGGPIDVGIKQSHLQPRVLCQGHSQVHCMYPEQVRPVGEHDGTDQHSALLRYMMYQQ